jgi:hypothetical protein
MKRCSIAILPKELAGAGPNLPILDHPKILCKCRILCEI